jgi:hypothetical protein
MLKGIACGSATRIDGQFAINRLRVLVDRVGTQDQQICDLVIGQPLRQETQHFDLTGSWLHKGKRRDKWPTSYILLVPMTVLPDYCTTVKTLVQFCLLGVENSYFKGCVPLP